jgi:hypothetical protein
MIVARGGIELTLWTELRPKSPVSEMPIRLRINGVDFLGVGWSEDPLDVSDEGNWLPLTPWHFALEGLMSLQITRTKGRFVAELNDYPHVLLLQMVDNDLAIASTMRGASARVHFDDCLQLFDEFFDRVQSYIIDLFPESRNFRGWDWKNTSKALEIWEGRYRSSGWRGYFDEFGDLLEPVK